MTIPPTLARSVLSRLRKKKHPDAEAAAIGLAAMCNPIRLCARFERIELAAWSDVDPTNWSQVHGYVTPTGRRRKGIAQDLVSRAEYGGRTAADLYDYIGRRRARNESARIGQFKLTENSPNTARITVGPDQRERRKKYVWERVGVQRYLAGVAAAGLITGTAIVSHKLKAAGGGSAWTGLKNIAGRASQKGRSLVSKAVGGGEVEAFIPHEGPLEKALKVKSEQEIRTANRAAGVEKAKKTKLQKLGEKYMMVDDPNKPILHPEGHPEAGKPVLHPKTGLPTFRKKAVKRPVPPKPGETPQIFKPPGAA